MSFNKVILMGNLTRDPELRYVNSGAAICSFGLAVNRTYKTSNGETRDETCFVDITVWGKLAETCKKFLTKGSQCLVEGRLEYQQWQDKESGKSRNRLIVQAENIRFVGSKPTTNNTAPPFPVKETQTTNIPPMPDVPSEFDDDIPF